MGRHAYYAKKSKKHHLCATIKILAPLLYNQYIFVRPYLYITYVPWDRPRCCFVRCVTLKVRVWGNALAPNRHNHEQFVRTSIQRSCNQRVVCLLCSIARIYYLWDGSLDKRKVRGLVPCCGQNGYRAQVP